MRGGIGFGRQAGHRLEHTVKMRRAHADGLSQSVERGWLVRIDDQFARLGHDGRLLGAGRETCRLAALAGSETSALRVLRRKVKSDILATGPPSRARRTAVDAGGLHGKDERVVRIFLAMDY